MTKENTKGLPLFSRLLIAFLGITVAISGMLVFVAYTFSKKSIEKRTQENISHHIASIGDRFKTEYGRDLKRNLRELASGPLLDDYLSSSVVERPIIARKLERLFLRMVADFEGYRTIYFIDPFGQEKIGVAGKNRVRKYRDLEQETNAGASGPAPSLNALIGLFNQLESEPIGKIHIEGPFTDADGETAFLAGISKLDYDTGEMGGILVIRCNLNAFFGYLDRVEFFGENPIHVFAPDGRVLKTPSGDDMATFDPVPYLPDEFQEELALSTLEQGILSVQDLYIVPARPFIRIAISIPTAFLLNDLKPAIQFFSIVFLFSILVVLMIALYLSRYLSTPIVELASAATRLAKGDLSTQVTVQTTGEVQMLVESFNHMTGRIKERTAELLESNVQLKQEIIERTQVERELEAQKVLSMRADRLRSLGEMAAGIAHELNQPLVGVRGLAEHTLIGMDRGWDLSDDKLRDRFTRIVEQTDRMVHIIEHVRMFAREAGKPELEPVQINDVVKSGIDMLSTQFKSHGVELDVELAEGLPIVSANPFSLEEVVLNLLNNARDAVEQRMKMNPSLSSARVLVRTSLNGVRAGKEVEVEIIDTGVGIPKDIISKVFDPFFTTKDPDKGTGLGLSVSRSIVEEAEGALHIQSTPGEGTAVTLSLPADDRPIQENQ